MDGALFRRVRRGGHITERRLTEDGNWEIMKCGACEAGLQGNTSGNSLPVESVVTLAQAGSTAVTMQVAGRWKSPQSSTRVSDGSSSVVYAFVVRETRYSSFPIDSQ